VIEKMAERAHGEMLSGAERTDAVCGDAFEELA
jgi:hypothetical protein